MMDDREFDRALEEELTQLPPADGEMERITPWKRAMSRIVAGIILTTCTLNVWNLQQLMPAVGIVLLWLSFRTLRKENGWFTACWLISLYRAASLFVSLVLNATLWGTEQGLTLWSYLNLLPPLVQFICLWQGIKAVRRKAGQPDKAGAAGALVWFYLALCVLGLWQLQGWLVVLPIGVIYFLILRSMAKMSALLDGAGYEVRAASVRVSDRMVWIVWVLSLAIAIPLAGIFLGRYPMDWKPVEIKEQAGQEEIQTNLQSLGMPEQVLSDLSTEDLFSLEGAVRVFVMVDEHPFNDGRRVTQVQTNQVRSWREYDVKELKTSDIAVELENGNWRIIHHFFWQGDRGIGGTECLKIWPTDRLNEGWRREGEPTGRVLYDRGGNTFESDFYFLGEESYTAQSIFWGQTYNNDLFAAFSLPLTGENCRGYVSYEIELVEEGWIIDSWSNYTHQVKWWNYPLMTAMQYSQAGMLYGGDFETAQSAIQLFDLWDSPEDAGEP
ncbi:hypothetical protein [Flavonifractor sp. An100]|uniref:hypothetical protein n=1 Tax=Flavonifractor sp. An100 TaxID=1965538 RepID=UPI000B382961|nr:hypothetical protein [Flavonifractor sp. An100]OUQ81085.1 hypothetical protein B5E43_02880 [Flavonifractor sp. An100]